MIQTIQDRRSLYNKVVVLSELVRFCTSPFIMFFKNEMGNVTATTVEPVRV